MEAPDLTRPRGDPFAQELRGFGVTGVLAIIVVLAVDVIGKPVGALAALAWAWRSHTPWRDVGWVRPRSWTVAIAGGLALGVGLKLLMKAVVMPLLGAPPTNETYAYLTGNAAALPMALYLILAGAAFGEEVLFRGFLFERVSTLAGSARHATAVAVAVTTLLFGVAHYADQGVPGTQQALIVGLVYAALRVRTGSLVMPIACHAAFNLTALAIIYWGLEARVGGAVWP